MRRTIKIYLATISSFIFSSSLLSQEYNTISSFSIDSNFNSHGIFTKLKEEQKLELHKLAYNHMKNNNFYFFGLFVGLGNELHKDQITESRSINDFYYYEHTINSRTNRFLKSDLFLMLNFIGNKIDNFGEEILDSLGVPIPLLDSHYISFLEGAKELNFAEKWEFKNNKFIKSNYVTSLFLLDETNFDSDGESFVSERIMFLNKPSSYYSLFKQDVQFDYLFAPQDYERALNKSEFHYPYDKNSILDGENAVHLGFGMIEILSSIKSSIDNEKIRLYKLDENGNKTSEIIESQDFSKYIETKSIKRKSTKNEIYDKSFETIDTNSNLINDIIYFENILGLRFYEDWDISNNSFSFKKNVKGIVCLIGDYNENGVLIGLKKIPVYIEFLK